MVNFRENNLFSAVEQSFLTFDDPPDSIAVGFSGGADSLCLLDLLVRLRELYSFSLSAIHVHHHLHADADQWADFCQQQCKQYGIDLIIKHAYVDENNSLGLEAAARQERYAAFEKTSAKVIALAHHQDDQIETFFLGLLRGGGRKALIGMPTVRELTAKQRLWRPLLPYSKKVLQAYLQERHLYEVVDDSNFDTRYTRNWLRHTLLPILREKIPCCDERIMQNIVSLQASNQLIDDVVSEDYQRCLYQDTLIVKELKKLSVWRVQETVLYFLKKRHLKAPRQKSLESFCHWLQTHKKGFYAWSIPDGTIYVSAGRLWFWSQGKVLWGKTDEKYFTYADVSFTPGKKGLSADFIRDSQHWQVRPIRQEDCVQTQIGLQSAFGLLKKRKIPSFVRHTWPVISNHQQECVAVIGVKIDSRYEHDNGLLPSIEALQPYLIND